MSSPGSSRCIALATVLAVWLGVVGVVAVGPAGATPAMEVTPSTDLLDAQTVQVSGTGFVPDVTVYVAMCPAAATSSNDCDLSDIGSTTSDDDGSFSLPFTVSRFVNGENAGNPISLDCAVDACAIGAGDLHSSHLVDISFQDVALPPPTLTVVPNDGLVDGVPVLVSGSGFRPGVTMHLGQCPADAADYGACLDDASTLVRRDGTFLAAVTVERILVVPVSVISITDCAPSHCIIGTSSTESSFVTAGLTFANPTFTATIEGTGTLAAGTNLAVVRATISCDMPTPLTVLGATSQPDIGGQFRLGNQECAPGAPVEGYFPTRTTSGSGNFALGTASVQLSVWPTASSETDLPASSLTAISGTVNLVDYASLRDLILAQLQDPANTDLRAAMVHAIQLRLQQDPAFRAELLGPQPSHAF